MWWAAFVGTYPEPDAYLKAAKRLIAGDDSPSYNQIPKEYCVRCRTLILPH